MSKDKRRQYGTGAVFQRSYDGRWVGRLEAGWTPQGTRRRVTVTAKTEAACKAKLKEKARQAAAGTILPARLDPRMTVKGWSEQWLPEHARHVRPTTYTTDAGAVRKWIVPTIGTRRLSDLTPADARRLRDAVVDAGRSTTTALHATTILRVMLKAAIEEGHAVPPGIMAAKKPKKAANDRASIPPEDARRLFATAMRRPEAMRWSLAMIQGMRQGEVLGLTWEAIDFDREELVVSWQLQDLPYRARGDASSGFRVPDDHESRLLVGRAHLTRPKTKAGRRALPLHPWQLEALATMRRDNEPNPWGLLWVERLQNGTVRPVRDATDRDLWRDVQREAAVTHPSGRPYVVHEARHLVASMLVEGGAATAQVEAILGQSKLVESYVHASDQGTRATINSLAESLGLGLTAGQS